MNGFWGHLRRSSGLDPKRVDNVVQNVTVWGLDPRAAFGFSHSAESAACTRHVSKVFLNLSGSAALEKKTGCLELFKKSHEVGKEH